MRREVQLTTEPIDEARLREARRMPPTVGAVVCFCGVVRDREQQAPISALEYEAHQPMARRQFEEILNRVETQWPVESIRLVHRLGPVQVNEPSFWVEVMSSHRAEAFAACQFLIDEMKRLVPIWKKPLG